MRTVIGHSHAPCIDEGAVQVGTSTELVLEYNRGSPSGWLEISGIDVAKGISDARTIKRALTEIKNLDDQINKANSAAVFCSIAKGKGACSIRTSQSGLTSTNATVPSWAITTTVGCGNSQVPVPVVSPM